MLKIVFIGCVHFSKEVLLAVLNRTEPYAQVVGIVTKSKSNFNADFFDLCSIAEEYEIPYVYADLMDWADMVRWVSEKAPDVVYCFGWSHLIKKDLLDLPRHGVVGYHPAELPFNRGRHPIIWTLALGLERTASTFFIMDEGADSGDIVSQETVYVDKYDDANSLYKKLEDKAVEQIEEITNRFSKNQMLVTPQNHQDANYWRKRSKIDGCIDWRMSSTSIYNLIRALTNPYPGAHCIHRGKEVIIWKAKDLGELNEYKHWEPGKVIASKQGEFIVKCGQGAIELIEHEFHVMPEKGSYL